MLTVGDVIAAKLLVQLGDVTADQARATLRKVARESDASRDLIALLQQDGALEQEKVTRARRYVALYEQVRLEGLYLQQLEKKGDVARAQAHELLAQVEAEVYRRRIGALLVERGKLTAAADKALVEKTKAGMRRDDLKVVSRYAAEDFAGVARPLVPGVARLTAETFRVPVVFRSPETQRIVRDAAKKLRAALLAGLPLPQAEPDLPGAASAADSILPDLEPAPGGGWSPQGLTRGAVPVPSVSVITDRAAFDKTSIMEPPTDAANPDGERTAALDAPPAAAPTPASGARASEARASEDEDEEGEEGEEGEGEEAEGEEAEGEEAEDEDEEEAEGAGGPGTSRFREGAAPDPAAGLRDRKQIGPYEVVECLGQGGMGAVYLGREAETSALSAVKVLLGDRAKPEDVARFRREVEILRRMDHPAVVHLIESGRTADGLDYMAIPAYPGKSLRSLLKQQAKGLPIDEALAFFEKLMHALGGVHVHRVVHRDVKPENLFVLAGKDRELRLLDFGIARLCDDESPAELRLYRTAVGAISGTPRYVAPETVTGDAIDGRTDLYSAGVMLFELLTGKLPFEAETPYDYARQHLLELPPTLGQARRDVAWHPDLEALVARLMAKEKEQRFPDCAAVLDVLRGGLAARAKAHAERPPEAQPPPDGVVNRFFKMFASWG